MIGGSNLSATYSSLPPLWIVVGAAFYLALAAGASIAVWRVRRAMFSREAAGIALLTALALLLRFSAHPDPSDIREVLVRNQSWAGWAVLLYLIYGMRAAHVETIWTINRFAGSISVPFLYVILRRRFRQAVPAVAGAAALAVTPLLVRFSASDTPYVLLCAAWLAAIVAFDSYSDSGSFSASVLGLALLTVAMQLRPETPWLIVPTALLMLTRWTWATVRAVLVRPAAICCALLFLAINAVPTVWGILRQSGSNFYPYWKEFVLIGAAIGSPWREPDMTPYGLAALVLVGAVAALGLRYGRSGLLWLAAALVAWPYRVPAARYYITPTTPNYANARYHIPAMYLACGLVGFGVETVFDLVRRRVGRAIPAAPLLATMVVCLAALPGFDLLTRMWAPQSEFDFFRRGLRSIDPSCRVVTLNYVTDAGFVPFGYLTASGVIDINDFLAGLPDLPPEARRGCFVYYRSGNCYSPTVEPDNPHFEMAAGCRAIEERFTLEPIIEADVAALPYRGESYVRDPLPVGFYRVTSRPQ
jgi:hypothetical protein